MRLTRIQRDRDGLLHAREAPAETAFVKLQRALKATIVNRNSGTFPARNNLMRFPDSKRFLESALRQQLFHQFALKAFGNVTGALKLRESLLRFPPCRQKT